MKRLQVDCGRLITRIQRPITRFNRIVTRRCFCVYAKSNGFEVGDDSLPDRFSHQPVLKQDYF